MTQTNAVETAAPANPWRRTRSGSDGRTSLLFWLTMLGLGCVVWVCVTWGASSLLAKKGPEKLLRADLFLPKLNSNHTSGPAPSEQAHPKDWPTTALHLPALFGHTQAKVVETPHHVEPASSVEPPRLTNESWLSPIAQLTPPAAVETCDEPVVYVQPSTLERGDSPMMRTWKTVSMYSLLAAAATLAPPPLLAQPDKGIVDKVDPIEKLQKSVDALGKRLDEIERKSSADRAAFSEFRSEFKKFEEGAIADISKNVKKLKEEMNAMQTEQIRQNRELVDLASQVESLRKKLHAVGAGPAAPGVDKAFMEELREFRTSIKALQETIAKLGPAEKRTSGYPNGTGAATKMGRVAIVNLYSEELLFMVNGVGYRVAPRSSKILDNVPTGALNYVVHSDRWGTLEDRVTSLAAGDTFTLTASNPR